MRSEGATDDDKLSEELKASIKLIIDSAEDLSDLTSNKIKDLLVGKFGRAYLNEVFGAVRKYIKDYLASGIDTKSIEEQVSSVINESKVAHTEIPQ